MKSSLVLWGWRMWQLRPILYQAQDPRWGRRNVQGWTKKVQAARRRRRGQPCPRRTEVTEGESGTSLRTASPGVPNKKTNTVGHLWGRGGRAILGEAVTSALNAHSWQSGCINEEMTTEQYTLVCYNSQQVEEGNRWDMHSSSNLHDQQMDGQDQWKEDIWHKRPSKNRGEKRKEEEDGRSSYHSQKLR